MNTTAFIKALASRLQLSQKETTRILDDTSAVIREMLVSDHQLTIHNLGKFQLKKTDSRESFIPALGKKALVPPRQTLAFHPSVTLKDKLKSSGRR